MKKLFILFITIILSSACGVKRPVSRDHAMQYKAHIRSQNSSKAMDQIAAENIHVEVDKNNPKEIDLNSEDSRVDLNYFVAIDTSQGYLSSVNHNGRKFLYHPPRDFIGILKIPYSVSNDMSEKQAELIINIKE